MGFGKAWTKPPRANTLPPPAIAPSLYRSVSFAASNDKAMTIEKSPSERSAAFRNLARGEDCVGLLYGRYCNCDPATTVLAHLNTLASNKGTGYKGHDHLGLFLGYECHSWLDTGGGTATEVAAFVAAAQGRMRERLAAIATDPMSKPWRREAARWAIERQEAA